jgi:hypothetical protein
MVCISNPSTIPGCPLPGFFGVLGIDLASPLGSSSDGCHRTAQNASAEQLFLKIFIYFQLIALVF